MKEQNYTFKLSGVTRNGANKFIDASSIDKLRVLDWQYLTFTIKQTRGGILAFLTFDLHNPNLKKPMPFLMTSKEDLALSTNFFKTFRQSPFRLLLFSSFSLLEKKGFSSFASGDGVGDNGVSHKKQIRQRIITHDNAYWGTNKSVHIFGEFPRLSISELEKVLVANKTVPKRLLPSESILRKVRANSYAAFELKKLGKVKYKAMRKTKLSRK